MVSSAARVRILVTGSREFTDVALVRAALYEIRARRPGRRSPSCTATRAARTGPYETSAAPSPTPSRLTNRTPPRGAARTARSIALPDIAATQRWSAASAESRRPSILGAPSSSTAG